MPHPQRLVEKAAERGQSQPTHWLFLLVPLPTFPNARARLRQDKTCSMDNPESQHWKSQVLFRKPQVSKGASTLAGQGGQGACGGFRMQVQLQPLFLSHMPLEQPGGSGASALQSWLPQTRKSSSRAVNTPGFSQGSRGWTCPPHSRSLFLSTVCLLLSTSLHSEGWQKKRTELSKAHQPGENSEARLQSPSRKRPPEPSESETLGAGKFEEALPPSNEKPNTEACG